MKSSSFNYSKIYKVNLSVWDVQKQETWHVSLVSCSLPNPGLFLLSDFCFIFIFGEGLFLGLLKYKYNLNTNIISTSMTKIST